MIIETSELDGSPLDWAVAHAIGRTPHIDSDGAYASVDAYGDLVLTANHHDPDKATDVVVVEPQAVIKLAAFIKEHYQEE